MSPDRQNRSCIDRALTGVADNIGLVLLAAFGLGIVGVSVVLAVLPSIGAVVQVLTTTVGVGVFVVPVFAIYLNPSRRR